MNKKYLLLLSGLFIFLFTRCSSTKYKAPEIINNSDRSLKTPDWVLSPTILSEENGKLIYIYKMNLDGASRPDACVAIARAQAIAEMMKYIKNSVTSSGQVEDLNASTDPSFSSLTAFLSQGNISGAQVTDSYWEQTIETDASSLIPIKKLQCAVKTQIDKMTLEKQMKEALEGAPGGNPEIRKKLIEAQKNFIENVGQQSTPETSSQPEKPTTPETSSQPEKPTTPETSSQPE